MSTNFQPGQDKFEDVEGHSVRCGVDSEPSDVEGHTMKVHIESPQPSGPEGD